MLTAKLLLMVSIGTRRIGLGQKTRPRKSHDTITLKQGSRSIQEVQIFALGRLSTKPAPNCYRQSVRLDSRLVVHFITAASVLKNITFATGDVRLHAVYCMQLIIQLYGNLTGTAYDSEQSEQVLVRNVDS